MSGAESPAVIKVDLPYFLPGIGMSDNLPVLRKDFCLRLLSDRKGFSSPSQALHCLPPVTHTEVMALAFSSWVYKQGGGRLAISPGVLRSHSRLRAF